MSQVPRVSPGRCGSDVNVSPTTSTVAPAPPTDPPRTDVSTAEDAFRLLGGMMVSANSAGLVALGLRLGLFRVMDAQGPLTSVEVATRSGLDERWVREWLFAQCAAGVIDYSGDGRFELNADVAALLADDSSLSYMGGSFLALPHLMSLLPQLDESFHTGRGVSYDAGGDAGADSAESLMINWYREELVKTALPQLEGLGARLENGAVVADVGCGSGIAVLELARAFPRSDFHGFDLSLTSLARAESRRRRVGLDNVSFHDVRATPLAHVASFDFVTTFDCLHDMANPMSTLSAIRHSIRDDGYWLIADIDCAPTFEENLRRRRLATMLYSSSVYVCLSSSLSEDGGAGLGTCGLPSPVLEGMVREVGFESFRRLDIAHPVNAFYEVRPHDSRG